VDKDEDDEIIEIIDEEPILVEATPWFNSDTVATSMMFASQLAEAAATHFHNLAMLALGQSAHEWVEVDREEFAEETAADISKIVVKEQDG
jgi:hypothetical protein